MRTRTRVAELRRKRAWRAQMRLELAVRRAHRLIDRRLADALGGTPAGGG